MGDFESEAEWDEVMPECWDFIKPDFNGNDTDDCDWDDCECWDNCDDDDECDWDDCECWDDCDDDDECDWDDCECWDDCDDECEGHDCDDDDDECDCEWDDYECWEKCYDEDDCEEYGDCDDNCEPLGDFECEYFECEDNKRNGDLECWEEFCSNGCKETCGMWYYNPGQEFWDRKECEKDMMPDIDPKEMYYKFREHFDDVIVEAWDQNCPDGDCVSAATSEFLVSNNVTGIVNEVLGDEEAKDMINATIEDVEELFDVNLDHVQKALELEDAA